jgi:hypothetical protein
MDVLFKNPRLRYIPLRVVCMYSVGEKVWEKQQSVDHLILMLLFNEG